MAAFEMIVIAIVTIALLIIIAGTCDLFERKPNKQRIHWNAKEGQIMTKAGECLYDRASLRKVVDAANKTIDDCNKVLVTIQRQLQCQAKTGHKMLFEKNLESLYDRWHIFKCKHCGLEITKTEKELKPAEREALKKLGIL